MQASIGAELEVERWLADYARARLTPGDSSKVRLRARVMREARLAFAGQEEARRVEDLREIRHSRSRRTTVRRGATLLLAAGLSVGVVGGALAASAAGGPLYGTRIWLEAVTLPAGGSERAAAELTRLEARMAEFTAAIRSGDRKAAAAALSAYEAIADEALAAADASGDQAAIARLTELLDRHLANLQRVAGQVPSQAAASISRNIERAILRSDAAIQRIQARPAPHQPNNQNGVGPALKPTQSAKPAATPRATATQPAAAPQEPVATPKPHPTAKPQPTPQPTSPPTPKPPRTPPGQGADH